MKKLKDSALSFGANKISCPPDIIIKVLCPAGLKKIAKILSLQFIQQGERLPESLLCHFTLNLVLISHRLRLACFGFIYAPCTPGVNADDVVAQRYLKRRDLVN
jgi:hypothetical protein